ncbi:NAD(P)-binding protein [Parathielavia appendiculata]|uniref:NAD(P)-binding protein n=1 Tax=Parathielavia appendiculata TaxID=2587402 RepID=A0AAN6U7W9_9PEZI|nr:NAD(P)-binding protein [Parathielavia appendiculata]
MADMKDGKFAHDTTVAPQANRVFPLFSLKGKTAIVSGANSGIGLAVAQALAEAGANVAIWHLQSKDEAEKAASEIEKEYSVRCKAYHVNVRSYDEVSSAIDAIVTEFNGRLDVFVANAGIPWTKGPMLDGPVQAYSDVIRTNLDGVYFCARAAGLHFRRQKQEGTTVHGAPLEPRFTTGSFIATASMSGHIVNVPQLQAAYNASKAAVVHLCRSLAVEWVGFARANSVSPGYINTSISEFCDPETKRVWKDKIPMGREGEVIELKGAYLYLASDASSYTTGTDVAVDGGYCAP